MMMATVNANGAFDHMSATGFAIYCHRVNFKLVKEQNDGYQQDVDDQKSNVLVKKFNDGC